MSKILATMGRHPIKDGDGCRPPSGKTFLTIGQDLFSIEEYVLEQWNASLHRPGIPGSKTETTLSSFTPAAVMVYTDIQTLRGLDQPVDYGSGIEYADGLLNDIFRRQTLGLQIGLWLNGTSGCLDILSGKLDSNMKRLFRYIEKSRASVVFLRVGYEFDNPWFGFSDNPQAYREAFARVVGYCRKYYSWCRNNHHKKKIQFVWHSWAAPRLVPLEDFYPGDELVDWVGISLFQQWYPWSIESGSSVDVQQVLGFAIQHDKPTMIAESTPFGGIYWNMSEIQQKHNNLSQQSLEQMEDPWQRWFQPTLDLIEHYDIAMWSYINCDWDSQPMWKGVGFGETRLSTSAEVMDQWKKHVLDNPRFLMAESMNECKPYHGGVISMELETNVQSVYQLNSLLFTEKVVSSTLWKLLLLGGCVVATVFLLFRNRRARHSQLHFTNPLYSREQSYGSISW